MPLIPWEYLEKCLVNLSLSPEEIATQLTAWGLETDLKVQESDIYLDFTILTNRPDLLSWWGIIREIGVLLNCQTKLPTLSSPPLTKKSSLSLAIATNNCSEYHLGLVKNVKVSESSPVVKKWLRANKIRSFNNWVDLANLVRLETGQHLLLLDYDTLPAKSSIKIRQAHSKERITIYAEQKLNLLSADVVITANEKIIGLAGISGGKKNEITWQTKNILIGSGSFNLQNIQTTTTRLSVLKISHHLFSQKINFSVQPLSILNYFVSLANQMLRGGKEETEIISFSNQGKAKKPLLTISEKLVAKKVGQVIPASQLEEIWRKLGFSFRKKGSIYYLKPPQNRPDITGPEDLCEEILRIYGYNKIPNSLPRWQEIAPPNHQENNFWTQKQRIRNWLVNRGWQEIITYSLVAEKSKIPFTSANEENFYQLLAPKNQNHLYYRHTLIPSHCQIINYNRTHGLCDLLFFEISSIYFPKSAGEIQQEELLALSATGKIFNQPVHHFVQELDFFWLKGILETIFALYFLNEEITFSPLCSKEKETRTEISLNQEKIGFLGWQKENTSKDPIFFAEISLTKVFNFLAPKPLLQSYRPVSNFPTSEKDLSLVLANDTDYSLVVKEIKRVGGDELKEVSIFDVYQNTELAQREKKSVSFHLIFQSAEKTLSKEQVEKNLEKINTHLIKAFQAKVRK
jgi:phenylalanyl-tRNA synthetase beta chain